MTDYHINVFYSAEDSGYIADIPDLDSCSAFGDDPAIAVAEVLVAKEAWLAAAVAAGRAIPKPRIGPRSTPAECADSQGACLDFLSGR